jgi:hypothetical protein
MLESCEDSLDPVLTSRPFEEGAVLDAEFEQLMLKKQIIESDKM